jgi:GNAT superfamily N-acetyltransferase
VDVTVTALTAANRLAWLAAAPDGRPLGTAFLRTGSGELDLHVHPAERRHGVGTTLLAAALAGARGQGRRSVVTAPVPQGSPGEAFCRARGLRQVLGLTYTRLDRAVEVPAVLPPAGYRLASWAGRVPDELAASFAAARPAMDDMPTDDADVAPQAWDVERVRAVADAVAGRGDHLVTVAALAPDGSIAGFTELVVPRSGAGDAQHYGTGVLPEHRGRGLARAMKAESIRLVRSRFPELAGLVADTADSNAAMRKVNDGLGYVPTHRALMFQADLA